MARGASTSTSLIGIGCIGASTLLFEILLTRIFSLTMWYHFAFVAISLALFGIAASGVVVSIAPGIFTRERALRHIGLASFCLGISIPIAFVLDLNIPFLPFESELVEEFGLTYVPHLLFLNKFMVLAVPFFFSGLAISLAFTHSPGLLNKVYFADLLGGGLGCALSVVLLLLLSGPSAVVFTASFAFVAAALFLHRAGDRWWTAISVLGAVAVVVFAMSNERDPKLAIERIKSYSTDVGQVEEKEKVYEGWHPVSRVAVHPVGRKSQGAWFIGKGADVSLPKMMEVTNDGGARTYIWPELPPEEAAEIFRHDVSDHAYKLTDSPKVLVVGVGGGKDILAGLALGAEKVTGVELNPLMIEVVQEVFGEFSGRPYDDPRAEIVVGEARNYVASHDDLYDIIKISVTDTWAASAGGAYALTESYLYTHEALDDFLDHLEPDGFVTITRWYPQETLRLVALAVETLRARGVEDPAKRMFMVRNRGVTLTLIIKNGEFTPGEEEILLEGAKKAKHGVIFAPTAEFKRRKRGVIGRNDERHRRIVTSEDLDELGKEIEVELSPPTDDKPFFFNIVSLEQAGRGEYGAKGGFKVQHGRALRLLLNLLDITVVVAVVFVLGPLLVARRIGGGAPVIQQLGTNVYFLALGLGYLLVEIPLLQQFILFLGDPTYAVTVVLFSLLISSGAGSLLAGHLRLAEKPWVRLLFVVIVVTASLLALVLADLLRALIGLPLAGRVLVSVSIIAPLGLVLGMPFPVGLASAHAIHRGLVPWAWAVNGAASVAAPVVAMVVAIVAGFTMALYLGAACYILAGAASFLFFVKPSSDSS